METTSAKLAKCLERLEIINSGLRWAKGLEKRSKTKILHQVSSLRNDLMLLTKVGRIKEKAKKKKDKAAEPYKVRREKLLERKFVFEGIFGDNPQLIQLLEILEKASRTDLPVLISGESGTGKELLAKVVHENSERSRQPFISVNCGAIPDALLESELFGHVKGAFTGAVRDKKGKFELADGGTLFLDEIGELSLGNQVKLLRALQENEIERIGSEESIFVDSRIVAATNRDLPAMLESGEFREDLYYRLSVITVTTPPLRERKDELSLLINYFLTEAGERLGREPVSLSSSVQHALERYTYPGNIRELQNLIYRLSCLAGDQAELSDLPENVRNTIYGTSTGETSFEDKTLEQVRNEATAHAETLYLMEKLKEFEGNVSRMSESMEMNRSYIQKLLKKYGLRSKEFKKVKR